MVETNFSQQTPESTQAYVRKKSESTLLQEGFSVINQRLEAMADDYRLRNWSEEQITAQLEVDKLTYQKEFLADAFPDQVVSPNIFRGFEERDTQTAQSVPMKSDISQWLGGINPNYGKNSLHLLKNPYHVNCGACAVAVAMKLSQTGHYTADDVGNLMKMLNENRDDRLSLATNDDMAMLTGGQWIPQNQSQVEDYLKSKGAGSHAIVGIDRAPYLILGSQRDPNQPAPEPKTAFHWEQDDNGARMVWERVGHWFNVCYDGNEMFIVNGQSGELFPFPYDFGQSGDYIMIVEQDT